jgi:putative FmdB family regulatory protein
MEGAVPIYSFHCKECKKSFTLNMPLSQYEKGKFTCPKCKSKKVEQQVAAFFAVTAKKS